MPCSTKEGPFHLLQQNFRSSGGQGLTVFKGLSFFADLTIHTWLGRRDFARCSLSWPLKGLLWLDTMVMMLRGFREVCITFPSVDLCRVLRCETFRVLAQVKWSLSVRSLCPSSWHCVLLIFFGEALSHCLKLESGS